LGVALTLLPFGAWLMTKKDDNGLLGQLASRGRR
jgi:hypothetical protein